LERGIEVQGGKKGEADIIKVAEDWEEGIS